MKKDIDKLLSRTLFTYFTILFVIFILKMFGLNYFGLDTGNKIINKINDFIMYWRLENVWYAITLYINGYVIFSITCNDNSKRMKKFTLMCLPLFILVQVLKTSSNFSTIGIIIDLLYLFVLSLCYIVFIRKDKIHKYNVANYWLLVILINIFQIISILTRDMTLKRVTDNFIIANLISFDFIILCMMTQRLYFIKGGKDLWVGVHSSFSDLLISLKQLPKRFLKSYQNSKPKKQEDELTYKIYIVLFWLYNFFTVLVVLFIATLNDTFIECIFILSSFWINKGVFG